LRTARGDQTIHFLLHRLTLASPVLKGIAGHHTLPLRNTQNTGDFADVSSNWGGIVASLPS
jgi:hypothetical protein